MMVLVLAFTELPSTTMVYGDILPTEMAFLVRAIIIQADTSIFQMLRMASERITWSQTVGTGNAGVYGSSDQGNGVWGIYFQCPFAAGIFSSLNAAGGEAITGMN